MDYKKLIDKYVSLSEYVRKNGLITIEDKFDEFPSDFEKIGLKMVYEGWDPVDINEVLSTLINTNLANSDVKACSIIRDAILDIHKGTNPNVMIVKLRAYLGIESVLEVYDAEIQ